MNKNVKAKWLKALRSGEYKQGNGRLGNPKDGFCCLGVLCDIAVKEGVIKTFDAFKSYPPSEVGEWAGLPTGKDGLYDPKAGSRRLSVWNDGCAVKHWKPTTFEKIADKIEKYL